nr:MATE family efflux transporter [Membranihabitans maritimus]
MKHHYNKINREIWALALPNIISNISVPLLSTVDTALMGRLSATHLGAVGISAMIFNFLYWNFGFLRMGTTGMTAQAYGASDMRLAMLTLYRAMGLGFFIAIILFLLRDPLADLAIKAFQVDGKQAELVLEYFYIRIWAAPAYMGFLCLIGWFFGMQNAIIPLVLTIVVNVLNMGSSFYFVQKMGWEIRGVAIGTLIAQYSGVLIGTLILLIKYRNITIRTTWASFFKIDEFRVFISTNKDLFIRTVLLTFVFAFFYSQSSAFGTISLAVSVVLMQFINWMSYGIDGIAFASESLVGKYKGARDGQVLDDTIRLVFLWGFVFAVAYGGLYGIFSDSLFRVFTDEQAVVVAGREYHFWLVLIPVIGFASYLWDGVFIGLTASKSMRNAMILPCILFLFVYYGFRSSLELHSLLLALSVFLLARGLIQTRMFWKEGVDLD